jgi:phage terminase large subunit
MGLISHTYGDRAISLRIPDFEPRPYQLEFLKAMDSGKDRAVLVWHRRAGKEIVCFNYMIRQAYWHRVGTYVYFFPTTRLGRRILWDGINKDGKRFISYIPKQIIEKINEQEMKIILKNGSIIQIIGTDLIENVGVNPVGLVFSEFSLQDPKAWAFTRPILRENQGWAVFNSTPRGRNHAYDMYLMAKNNPEWFCQKLSILDTGVLTEEDMDSERREGMSEQMIQQEYYCNFDQGVEGSYYAKLLNQAEIDGRLTSVPYDPNTCVDTYWDLGVSDETVVLFCQNVGNQIHIINMYRNQGEGLGHYAKFMQDQASKYGYVYGDHYAPHDIQVRELGSGAKTRLQIAKDLGIRFQIVPKVSIFEGIELCRGIFHKLWIDSKKCNYFIKCAEDYHKAYNERLNVYSDKPVHNWASHTMDAFRYMAIVQTKRYKGHMSEEEARNLERMYSTRRFD